MAFLDPTKAVMTETRTMVMVVQPLVMSSRGTLVVSGLLARKSLAYRFAEIVKLRMANPATTETL
jgi:hypothetical protein